MIKSIHFKLSYSHEMESVKNTKLVGISSDLSSQT